MLTAQIFIGIIFLMIIGFMVYKVWFEKPKVRKADDIIKNPNIPKTPKNPEKSVYKVILTFDEDKVIEVSDALNKFFSTKYREVVEKGSVSVNAEKETEFILTAENKELQTITFDFFSKEIGKVALIKKA